MSAGLAALLDDVAVLARAAAASVDDIATGNSPYGIAVVQPPPASG